MDNWETMVGDVVRGMPDKVLYRMVTELPDDSATKKELSLVIGQRAVGMRGGVARAARDLTDGEGKAARRRPKSKASTEESTGAPKVKGQKRPPQELAQFTEKVYGAIRDHAGPNLGVEQLGKILGVPTKDLALPLRKLVKSVKVKTKGQKRATRYFLAA